MLYLCAHTHTLNHEHQNARSHTHTDSGAHGTYQALQFTREPLYDGIVTGQLLLGPVVRSIINTRKLVECKPAAIRCQTAKRDASSDTYCERHIGRGK